MNFRNILLLTTLICLSFIVFASNPSITAVDYNQFYAGRQGTFNVAITPDGTSGNLVFYNSGVIVTQQPYTPTSSTFAFNRIYSNPGDYNVWFVLTDFNFLDNTNTADDRVDKTVHVKTGIDVEISSITVSPQLLERNGAVTINVAITNIGDDNGTSPVPVLLYFDSNLISSKILQDENVGVTTTLTTNWIVPNDFNGGILRAVVNTAGYFTEFNITNNEKTINLSTSSAPDLSAASIVTEPNIKKNSLSTISLRIDNNGGQGVNGATVEVFYDSVADNRKIYSTTIDLAGMSSKSLSFVYVFSENRNYNLLFIVNRTHLFSESNFSNNELDSNIYVADYSVGDILAENASLKQQLLDMQNRYNTSDTEKELCLSSLTNQRALSESCTSNLAICNENNNTKIANYMIAIDANREAEKTIYLAEVSRIGREKSDMQASYEIQIAGLNEEINQWSMVVVGGLLAFVGWLAYMEWAKRKGRKAINTNG